MRAYVVPELDNRFSIVVGCAGVFPMYMAHSLVHAAQGGTYVYLGLCMVCVSWKVSAGVHLCVILVCGDLIRVPIHNSEVVVHILDPYMTYAISYPHPARMQSKFA